MPPSSKVTWQITIQGGRYQFTRYVDGAADESYGAVDRGQAAVYAAAMIHGIDPPRALRHADTPEAFVPLAGGSIPVLPRDA